MPVSMARNLRLTALCCLLAAGCGSRTTEGAPPAKASTSAVAAKQAGNSAQDGSAASAGSGGAWDCGQYGGGVGDFMSQSAAYLFIGDHPMCADKEKLQQFCKALDTVDGFTAVEGGDISAEAAEQIAQTLPEESRDGFMQQHPQHSFEQAMAKCGLNTDQVRTQLGAEVDASIKAGKKDDFHFLLTDSPSTAEVIWKRECAGRIKNLQIGETYKWEFKGNPNYEPFCEATTQQDRPSDPATFNRRPR